MNPFLMIMILMPPCKIPVSPAWEQVFSRMNDPAGWACTGVASVTAEIIKALNQFIGT